MNILTVYPIIRGAFKDELTYWSAHAFKVGSIIDVPLRGRTIPALIGSVTPATHAKANIKQASFVTRKIDKLAEKKVVRTACIRACEKTAIEYAVPFGAVLKACIPDAILADPDLGELFDEKNEKPASKEKEVSDSDLDKKKKPGSISADILVYQTNTADRLSTYKSIVREEFARKKSMLIVAPTGLAAEELFHALKKGIEDYVIVLHGNLTKKKQLALWKQALTSNHPVLVIATPHFASIPREDISTIVLERESSRGYSAVRAPYIDYRDYIEYYARAIGTRLILGDSLLRIETLHRRENGELSDFFPLSYRIEKNAEVLVVDMNASRKEQADAKTGIRKKEEFRIMSEELVSMIEYSKEKSERMFIFSARRGLSPQIVCGDCGQTVQCNSCHAPVVLHQGKSEQGRFFLCHHCGTQRSALEACQNCKSWKLVTLGIGADTVAEEIRRKFPGREIFRLDKDTVKTDKQAKDLVADFEKSKDGILIGTESALAFLPEVKYGAIASLDSLFSIPDFRINERISRIILRMIEKTTGYLLIQTRNAGNSLLKYISSGTLSNFYHEEIEARQMAKYPPFSKHIKITIEDTRASAAEKMGRLQDMLEKWDPMIFPAFIPTRRGKSVLHMLLSLDPDSWPDNELRSIIASLPKEYTVRVNPESLL